MTLIVGYNGSGKTTIIECLKYATTGELPPNSKGGAFIHDPKLCGEKEVLAQVKLAFRSTAGLKFVATRSLQLTVKKTTRSLKTLEGNLVCYNNGERTTISSKVADLDEVVPRELGVSQAILDAVIFCHQDESLWPMSEPAVLKKRFDELFEAMRYTKAIDNIKVLKRKQGEILAQLKIHEEQDKANKEKGESAERQSISLQVEIEALRDQCEAISDQMQALEKEIKDKREQANSFPSIVQDLKNKQSQLDYREDDVEKLKTTLEEMHESDEWLEESLAQYEGQVGGYRSQIEEMKSSCEVLQGELASSRGSLQERLSEQGKHQSDKEKYERQVRLRDKMIRDVARLRCIRGFEGDIDNKEVQAFRGRLTKLLADKTRELDLVQNANSEELEKATTAITDLEGKRVSKTNDRVSAKNRMSANDKSISSLLNQITPLDVDDVAVSMLRSKRCEIEACLAKETARLEEAKWDEQIQEENTRLDQVEAENSRLGSELVERTLLAEERAQLDLRKKEHAERQRQLDVLTNTCRDKLADVLHESFQPETVDKQFSEAVASHSRVLEDRRRRRDATANQVEQVEFMLSTSRAERNKKSAASAAAKKKVNDALAMATDSPGDVDAYYQEVEALQNEIQQVEKDIALFGALDKYYTQCSQTLERQDKCKLCDRSFKDQPEVRTRLRDKIRKLLSPEQKIEVEADRAALLPLLKGLRDVQLDYDSYKRLSSEMPTLDSEIKTMEAERDELVRKLEEKDQAVKDAQDQQWGLESLSKQVGAISQLVREISEGKSQISRLESRQQPSWGSRSAEEIHELQTTLGEQVRTVKQKLARLTGEKQRARERVSSLELEKSELTSKMNSAEGQLKFKQDLESQVQTLREDTSHQLEIIQEVDKELRALEPEISNARAIREDTLARGRAKEKSIDEDVKGLFKSSSELEMIESDIQDYTDRGGSAALAATQHSIEALEEAIDRFEKEIADVTDQMDHLREEMSNGDRRKKNISDNINYRKKLRDLDSLRREIADLESRNATDDYDRLIGEAQRCELLHSKLLEQRSSMMGAMKTKDDHLERLVMEWDMDYKDAANKYRESHIKVETTKAAIEDLGKFAVALDKAVMEYHKRKMEDVNRIAGELWQSTYQGTDIDTILIRSDHETATRNRSYNYRVCMVKQDTEMDMRGRCSAGQKVLASIVIRLALAESFGVNCGLIALDEPTTNLDRDNIRSLAASLHAIIEARQQQSNFQLIVITHDEEFLRHMKCGDFCDTFFRVSRNERQNSIICMESISKVSE